MRIFGFLLAVACAGSAWALDPTEAGARKLSVGGVEVTVNELIERAKNSPSLFVTKARIGEIRRRIASDATISNTWAGLVRRLDGTLRWPMDIPDRGGGWCHHFFCRKCASPLTSESPTRHVCTHCKEVHSGSPYDDVYVMNVHNENCRLAEQLGFAYQVSGDRKYADRVREMLLAYAKVYLTYKRHTIYGDIVNASAGRVGPQTLEESMWLIRLSQAYDMIVDTLSASERETIKSNLLRPSAQLILGFDKGIGNWQCWHLSAFCLAGLLCGDPVLVAEAVTGPKGYLMQLQEGVFDDGIWNECAWGYHFYTLNGLLHVVTALNNLGVPPPPRFKLMFDSAFGEVMPNFMFPAMNDSGLHNFRHDVPYYEFAWTWWKDPLHAWWLAQNSRGTMENLTQGSALPSPLPPTPVVTSKLYPHGGLAVLRSNAAGESKPMPGNYVSVEFGIHGGWHGHPDKLNLTLFTRGELMVEDPGMTGYGNPRQWGWFRTTLAHNTLVVDGTNQCPATGSCEAFATDGNASVVSCLAGDAYGAGTQAGRLTALVGDVVLDYLWVRSDRERDLEWSFHSRGDFTTPLKLTPITMPPPRRPALVKKNDAGMDPGNRGEEAWSWTHDNAEGAHDGCWQAQWKRGQATLGLFQRAPAGVIRTGTGTGSPASEKCRLAVNRVARQRNAAFATVLTLDGETDVSIEDVLSDPDGTEGFVARVRGIRYVILRSPADSCRGYPGRVVVLVFGPDGRPIRELKAASSSASSSSRAERENGLMPSGRIHLSRMDADCHGEDGIGVVI